MFQESVNTDDEPAYPSGGEMKTHPTIGIAFSESLLKANTVPSWLVADAAVTFIATGG